MRRLAAIMATDVVGYSRLMSEDEVGTLARLKAVREKILDPAVAARGGRLFKTMGDGTLVEFASVVDALECAAAIQRAMTVRDAESPDARPLQLRIGVTLGDVIVERDPDGAEDIFGDGVNIAARLQEIAEPGGIVVSHTVLNHVRNKVTLEFVARGEQYLKNIEEKVAVFDVHLDQDLPRNARTCRETPARSTLRTASPRISSPRCRRGGGFR